MVGLRGIILELIVVAVLSSSLFGAALSKVAIPSSFRKHGIVVTANLGIIGYALRKGSWQHWCVVDHNANVGLGGFLLKVLHKRFHGVGGSSWGSHLWLWLDHLLGALHALQELHFVA